MYIYMERIILHKENFFFFFRAIRFTLYISKYVSYAIFHFWEKNSQDHEVLVVQKI